MGGGIEAKCRTKWELMLELQPQSIVTETEISVIHQKRLLFAFMGWWIARMRLIALAQTSAFAMV